MRLPQPSNNLYVSPVITAVVRKVRRCLCSPVALWMAWLLNAAVFCALFTWILRDGKFPETALALSAQIRARVDSTAAVQRLGTPIASRLTALKVVGLTAVVSAVCIFIGLFAGPTAHRRIRSWLMFTVLIAAWLALLVSWPELAWRGQAGRVAGQLDGFDRVASSLRSNWPTEDGERNELGLFMAYPIGAPRMLMLLTTPEVSNGGISFSAVERSAEGALRFQLTGNEHGAWVEWHPSGSAPATFVGGLMSEYRLGRYMPLGRCWFLVRYDEGRGIHPLE